MLAIAKRAFPVNATPALLQIAGDKGWPVFYPAGSDQLTLPSECVSHIR